MIEPTTPRRVLVHPGFHKTGTSSLQGFLVQHRDPLAGYFYGFGRDKAPELDLAATQYSQRPFRWRLWAFQRVLRTTLSACPADRDIVISMESLSGLMPGHRVLGGADARDYARTAIPMGKAIIQEIRAIFGAQTEIIFLYTTREKSDWLRSVHGHLLRSIRFTDDLKTFRDRFESMPDLNAQADQMALALPDVRVERAALEDYTLARTGPARAVLDLMGVPKAVRKSLAPTPRANIGQPGDLRDSFLRLNRDISNKAELRTRKDSLLAAHAKGLIDV